MAVGTRMPEWVDAGFRDYAKRMPREMAVELVELKPASRAGLDAARAMEIEAGRIAEAVPRSARRVVLDERGEDLDTAALARRLEGWRGEGRDVALVIGGADGLSPSVKRGADERLRLSSLTLPHGLVRVVLAEQLYRAASLLRNHPYHRA